jgi:oligoribonuclease
MPQDSSHLIWIDLEMTGLDPNYHTIIEVATLVTTVNLDVVAEGPVIAIHQSDEVLIAMDEWNTCQHQQSGLTERVRHSEITLSVAEQMTLNFLTQHVPANTSPMCGNTVSQDRRFLYNYMPKLEQYFHYRHIDVSTLKELAKRWQPQLPEFKKASKHLALADIHESLAELKYYRQHFLRFNG